MKHISVPVVLFIFKRPDTTLQVIDRVREVQPPKVYIVGEGYRPNVPGEDKKVEEVRLLVEKAIDWPCEIHKNYVSQDIGVGKRMSSGISWVFENEESAIFLEDDILVDRSFFYYAEELLNKYKNDDKVMMISARNSISDDEYNIDTSYTFSTFGSIWGWATWKRAWIKYDYDLSKWNEVKKSKKFIDFFPNNTTYNNMTNVYFESFKFGLNTWDYQWNFAIMYNNGLIAVPQKNLMTNIGFRPDGTHTTHNLKSNSVGVINEMYFPLSHPDAVERNKAYEKVYCLKNFSNPDILTRIKILLHHIKLFFLKQK